MPMFVSIATIRRGTASAASAANAGRMASSHGSASVTPAPRRNARRDNGERPMENGDDSGIECVPRCSGQNLADRLAAVGYGDGPVVVVHLHLRIDAQQMIDRGADVARADRLV